MVFTVPYVFKDLLLTQAPNLPLSYQYIFVVQGLKFLFQTILYEFSTCVVQQNNFHKIGKGFNFVTGNYELTKNNNEGHLDCLDLSLGYDAPGTRSPAVVIFLLKLLMT